MKNSEYLSSKNKLNSTLDFYIVHYTIGSGSSSKVKLVTDPFTNQVYAAKIIKPLHRFPLFHYRNIVLSEVSCLRKVPHQYIVKFFTHSESGSYVSKSKGFYKCLYIILEYCPHGDLFTILQYGGLGLNLTLFLFRQIFSALEFCVNSGYSHGDLKLENILIGPDYYIRLIDFAHNSKTAKKGEILGTEHYLPPEARNNELVDVTKADLFVVGIILFTLFAGCPPFSKSQEDDMFFQMLNKDKDQYWAIFENRLGNMKFSDEFKEIVQGLLEINPDKRWSFKDVLESGWFLQSINEEEAKCSLKRIVDKQVN